jgi:PAS domain S-box-containing protein
MRHSDLATESAAIGSQLWDISGATSPSGKAFTRAFDLAHAMVRDLDGHICFWSSSMESFYGWSRAEALGRMSHDLLKTEFPKLLSEINAELLRVGHWDGELRHRTQDGRTIVVSSHWALDRDEAGRPAWVIEVNNDVTAQKTAEALLRVNLAELQSLLDAVPGIVWIAHDTECRSVTGSRASYKLLRLPIGTNPSLTAPESERPVHFKVLADGREVASKDLPLQRAARGETIQEVEFEVVFDDGTSRWLFGNAVPLLDDTGRPRGAVSAFVDVSERREAENRYRTTAELLQRVMASIPDYLWSGEVDERGRWKYNYYSPVVERITGRPPSFYMESPDRWLTTVYADDRASCLRAFQRIANGESEHEHAEYRIVLPDGQIRWVRDSATVTRLAPHRFRVDGVVSDVTGRVAAEAALRASTAELQTILDTVPAIVWVAHDAEGRSLTGSRAAYEFLRLLPGTGPSSTLPESARFPHFKVIADGRELALEDMPVQRAARGETVRDYEMEVVFDDGTSRWFFGNAVALLDDNGRRRGAVSTFVDVTERKRADAALRAQEAAEKANQAKSDFLALLSHEIRTPITSVIGMTELLLDSNLTARQRHQATLLKDAGELLLALINDVLDMSKIEAGKLELEQAPLEPSEVAEAALAIVRPQAVAKNIELRREIAADLPACIKGDPTRLRQILLNLLSNAVKFTECGSVTLEASREGHADAMRLRFEVADTGIGIDTAQQDRLFQPFSQLSRGGERRPGTGLGLAISRQLVEAMGGTIGVESRIGKGSIFWFAIPYEEIQLPAKAEPTESALAAGSRGRILVAEDQYMIRELMEAILTEAGHEVVLVGDGAEAIAALERGGFDLVLFDLVLMDVEMPEMGGLAAMQRIRQMDEPIRNVPIIALTAYAMAGDAEKCRAAGADGYLSKPVKRKDLLSTVEKWMARKRALSAAGANDREAAPVIDAAVLSELEDNLGKPMVMEFAESFRKELTEKIKSITSTTDRKLIGEQAHAIVSLAGYLGCAELMRYSRALMDAARCETGDLDALVAELAAATDRALSAMQERYPG